MSTIGKNTIKQALNLTLILDTSGSMTGPRIAQLNHAMPDMLRELNKVALKQEVDAYIRVIEFNTQSKWIIGDAENGVKAEDAVNMWSNLNAGGGTDTAAAIKLCLDCLRVRYLGTENYLPVVVLITDGESNDFEDTKAAIELMKKALAGNTGKEKVKRIAVGVQDYNEEELIAFASTGTIDYGGGNVQENVPLVFKVDNVSDLSNVIKNIAVSSLYSATGAGEDVDNVELVIEAGDPGEDVWAE